MGNRHATKEKIIYASCVVCGNSRPSNARRHWSVCSSNCRNKKQRALARVEKWKNCMLDCFADLPEVYDHQYWNDEMADILTSLASEFDELAFSLKYPGEKYHHQYRLTEAGRAIQTKRGR